ncbi:MAG TPA: hypothetical protein VLA00_14795 [Xanthobacteraceae bacterium]|nr:hypothetical protein [Xanthobacteraceae bacterium]
MAAGLVLSGCVYNTSEKATFTAEPGQQTIVRDGREVLISRKGGSEVTFAPKKLGQGEWSRPTFVVIMCNGTKEPTTFRYSEISAYRAEDGTPLKVWNVDQLQQEAREAAILGAVLMAGVAAGGAAVAANNAGTYSGSGTVYGAGGSTTYTWRGYDPVAAQLAAAPIAAAGGAAAGGIVAQGQRTINDLEYNMLVDNTIFPGQCYGGTAVVNADTTGGVGGIGNTKNYVVRIPFAGQVHQFSVSLARVPNR